MRELLLRLDSRELTEWMAFWQLDPWGDSRADLRAGVIASTIANVHRGADTRPYKPMDFMPYAQRDENEEARSNVATFKAMFAHKVKRNG